LFAYKTGFGIEDTQLIDGTNFTLKAYQSKIIILDEDYNGVKLEGFYKDGKRVSLWVNMHKNWRNDLQNQVGGKDEVVINELDLIYNYMQYNNLKLITAIEKYRAKYC
jgi:hypothetical protein